MTAHDPAAARGRVSTIELFFDLVFVFTVTQLTHLIDHAHGLDDFVRALVVLVLIGGAAGFLVLSQTIPTSFGEGTLSSSPTA